MKSKPTNRLVAAAALAAAAALTMTGCATSSSSSASSGPVTLKLVAADYGTGPSNSSSKYWQSIADAFHKKNPNITVKVQTVNWNDFDSQVQTSVQNHQYPDITEGDYFSTYAQEGLLYKASDVLSTPSNLLPAFKAQGSYKGTQYGMPFTTSSRTLFYNKALFAKAGITAAPTTWADIQADSAKIKSLGKIGFGLPLGSEEAQAESMLWMMGDGGGYQSKPGTYDIDSSKNVASFQFLNKLVSAGDTEPNPGSANRTDLWKQFAQGQIGMINGSPALVPIIQAGGVLKTADWASVQIAGKTGPLTKTLGVSDNVAAFNKNGHEAQIKKFLDFTYQDKYQIQFDKEYDLLPATTTAANKMASDPLFGSFIKALPQSVQYPIDTAWPQVKTKVQQTIGTAVTGDPSKVLSSLQSTAKAAQAAN
ncbi:ABC transporter substrate-binding protein [Frondihabitans sp. PAMC 28766]|uniref:extracellular solute-binding protein n=1 Tax=Frondihabitans sp. PAMC 28766 TaxID=1795630 RepID=UPI00078E2A54|nr:extracellular solute-binding protein [Frondihabitans sp. PAMC 28766]AMM19154.1 ABC transporter substrate-binding protein [Frondihabitans sp. PAMC 28766]